VIKLLCIRSYKMHAFGVAIMPHVCCLQLCAGKWNKKVETALCCRYCYFLWFHI